MSTELTIKKGRGVPKDAEMAEAELALDLDDGTLYSKLGDGLVHALNEVPDADNYGHWKLQVDYGTPYEVESGRTANFEGKGGVDVSLSGDTVTVDGSGIVANLDADNYQYWQYKINGFSTTDVLSTQVLDFQSGDGIQIDKEGYGIKISATGGGGGGIEEAPKTGKLYARKDAAWEEFATGNLDDGNKDGEILTWDTASANWTHTDDLTVSWGIAKFKDRGSADGELRIFQEDSVAHISPYGDRGSSTNSQIVFTTGYLGGTSSERMRIHANGDVSTSENLRIQNKTGGVGSKSELTFVNSPDITGQSGRANIVVERVDSGSGGYDSSTMTFSTTIGGVTADFSPRMTINAQGRVGIGGTPSRSTKEIEEEAEATLRNWDSKDKKPTKAELIKKLAERNIGGGGNDLLQVNGYGYFAGGVVTNSGEVFRRGNSGIFFNNNYVVPLDNTAAWSDGKVDLGTSGSRFKDGYFSGAVSAGDIIIGGTTVRRNGISGIHFGGGSIRPVGTSNTTEDAVLDLGATAFRFKDGYFSNSVKVTGGDIAARNNNITVNSDTVAGYLAVGGAELYSWNTTDFRGQQDAIFNLGDPAARWKDGHFSGLVHAAGLVRTLSGMGGVTFNSHNDGPETLPTDTNGIRTDGQMNLGRRSAYRYKNAFLTGDVYAANFYGKVADVPDHVKAITPTQIANWDAGTGGGGGGATTDGRISDTQIIHWDQAYSWGNHANAGYQPAGSYATTSDLSNYVPKSGNTTISGTLTATDFVASSDERLKDNISPMPVGLIDDIKPVQWTWKDSGKKSAGVIAQQLQEIGLGDFVTEGEDGMLGVNYNALVSVLLAEVISLKKELAK